MNKIKDLASLAWFIIRNPSCLVPGLYERRLHQRHINALDYLIKNDPEMLNELDRMIEEELKNSAE